MGNIHPEGETAREELNEIKTGIDLFCAPLKEKTQLTRYSKYSMFKANHKGGGGGSCSTGKIRVPKPISILLYLIQRKKKICYKTWSTVKDYFSTIQVSRATPLFLFEEGRMAAFGRIALESTNSIRNATMNEASPHCLQGWTSIPRDAGRVTLRSSHSRAQFLHSFPNRPAELRFPRKSSCH